MDRSRNSTEPGRVPPESTCCMKIVSWSRIPGLTADSAWGMMPEPHERDPRPFLLPAGAGRHRLRDGNPRDPLPPARAYIGRELSLGVLAAPGPRILRLPGHDRLDGMALDDPVRPQ